jgi:hypothetical protein
MLALHAYGSLAQAPVPTPPALRTHIVYGPESIKSQFVSPWQVRSALSGSHCAEQNATPT